jgi:hypothetical protein
MSSMANSGAIAFTAGCPVPARKSAAAPGYEMPVAPRVPSDQGCATIHSASWAKSSRSRGERNESREPKLAPVPRTSITTSA